MENMKLTPRERSALRSHWQMLVRVKDGNVELFKRGVWGILCNLEEGKKNAQMILQNSR